MNKIYNVSELIRKNSTDLGGIFTYSDLAALIGTSEKTMLPRQIRQLEKAGVIRKFIRGVYLDKSQFNPWALSQRLSPTSYISMESILAKNLIIGTVPQFRVSAVKTGRRRIYQAENLAIEQVGIAEELFFGFSNIDGIQTADSEKALLDCLYYYQKGRRTTFSIHEDINWNLLDVKKFQKYLKKYKNPKFIKFVECIVVAR